MQICSNTFEMHSRPCTWIVQTSLCVQFLLACRCAQLYVLAFLHQFTNVPQQIHFTLLLDVIFYQLVPRADPDTDMFPYINSYKLFAVYKLLPTCLLETFCRVLWLVAQAPASAALLSHPRFLVYFGRLPSVNVAMCSSSVCSHFYF